MFLCKHIVGNIYLLKEQTKIETKKKSSVCLFGKKCILVGVFFMISHPHHPLTVRAFCSGFPQCCDDPHSVQIHLTFCQNVGPWEKMDQRKLVLSLFYPLVHITCSK